MSEPAPDLRVFADYERDFDEDCDVVVVGSGPAGAVVAKELTDAGAVVTRSNAAACKEAGYVVKWLAAR